MVKRLLLYIEFVYLRENLKIRHIICIFSTTNKKKRNYSSNDTKRSGVWTGECRLNLESRITVCCLSLARAITSMYADFPQ